MTKADDYNSLALKAGDISVVHVTEAVRCAQVLMNQRDSNPVKLVVDGIAGPKTRERLERLRSPAPTPPVDKLAELGRVAVDRALIEWRKNIADPKASATGTVADVNRKEIDRYVRSPQGAGWHWLTPYRGDGAPGNPEWCGMFAAYCWAHAIALETRRDHFPSTYRLDSWSRAVPGRLLAEFDEHGDDAEAQHNAACQARPGDILLVGDGRPAYGDHVTVVERYDVATGMFSTVEGNGGGIFPTGLRGHGVVKGVRPLGPRSGHSYIARRLIRPLLADLIA